MEYVFTNPLHISRVWQKVIFKEEFNRFDPEFFFS